MRKIPMLIFLIVSLFIVALLAYPSIKKSPSASPQSVAFVPTESESLSNSPTSGKNSPVENQNLPSTISPSSGGGSASGSPQQNEQQNCIPTQISYSLKNFASAQECLSMENEICQNKKVECKVEVSNLDYALAGEFEVEFLFINTNAETLALETVSVVLLPRTFQTLSISKNFNFPQSSEEITCNFRTTKVPKKFEC